VVTGHPHVKARTTRVAHEAHRKSVGARQKDSLSSPLLLPRRKGPRITGFPGLAESDSLCSPGAPLSRGAECVTRVGARRGVRPHESLPFVSAEKNERFPRAQGEIGAKHVKKFGGTNSVFELSVRPTTRFKRRRVMNHDARTTTRALRCCGAFRELRRARSRPRRVHALVAVRDHRAENVGGVRAEGQAGGRGLDFDCIPPRFANCPNHPTSPCRTRVCLGARPGTAAAARVLVTGSPITSPRLWQRR